MATEELFVNAFDSDKTAWTEVGDSPYLHDTDGDSIYSNVNLAEEGDFDFADSGVGAGTISSVKLKIEGSKAGSGILWDAHARIYVWDGSAWVDKGWMEFTSVYAWSELDVSGELDSWSKINGARLYLKAGVLGTATVLCRRAKLVIDYTPIVPPPPPAKPLINKPLINPILINPPMIR